MAKISIVIPAYNITPMLYQCLESLKKTATYIDFEIIVIHSKGSFAENCNRGIEASRGEFICLLNDDTVVTDYWLDSVVELMNKDSKIAAVSPMMLFPDGRVQFGGMIFHDDYCGGHLGWSWLQDDPRLIRSPHEFQATTFGCVLLRRDALYDLLPDYTRRQFIDEAYKVGGYEDIDTCFRLKLNGWKIYYQPASRIFHAESQTFNSMPQEHRQKTSLENRNLYLKRWKEYFEKGTFKIDDKDYDGGLENYGGK